MASPRIRRLTQDYELLKRVLHGSPAVQISGTAGLPPEIYRFTYTLKGLYVSPTGDILERDTHILEVNLTLDYPRRAPQCRMLTPVFHPNFDETSVCIGDFWAASEGLDDLIFRIGRMISYQEYNTKSPLNGLAAKWAAEHLALLPVDPKPIGSMLQPEMQIPVEAAPAAQAAVATVASSPAPLQPVEDPWDQKIVIRNG
jgi:ubiquitin-protein ligase